MKPISHHTIIAWCVVILFGVVGTKAYFNQGLFTAHDIWHQVARWYWYTEALKDGQLLPGWIMPMANGYGYPLFIFSYHLPWLVGFPLALAGANFEVAVKLLFGASFVGSGVLMYLFLVDWLKHRVAATVGAVIYLWAPYHFLTLFVSAAIGTAFTFTLLPLILWGILLISRDGWSRRGIVFLTLGSAGVILSHMMTLVMVAPLMLLWLGYCVHEHFQTWMTQWKQRLRALLVAGGLTLGLVSYYLLPLIAYLPLIKANDVGGGFAGMYQNFFPSMKQLVYSRWGVGPIVDNAKDGEISLQVGIAQWLGMLLLISLLVVPAARDHHGRRIFWISGLYLASIFLMLDISKPVWELANTVTTLDYPFRLLLLAVCFGSIGAAVAVAALPKKLFRIGAAVLLIAAAVYTNRNHIRVNQYTNIPLSLYIASEKTTNTFNEYLPKTAHSALLDTTYQPVKAPIPVEVSDFNITPSRMTFTIAVPQETVIQVGQFVFPGMQTLVNEQVVEYNRDGDGLIELMIPSGRHTITVRSTKTLIMQIGLGVSFVSIIVMQGILLWPKLKPTRNQK